MLVFYTSVGTNEQTTVTQTTLLPQQAWGSLTGHFGRSILKNPGNRLTTSGGRHQPSGILFLMVSFQGVFLV